MKGYIIFVIILISSLPFISAGYSCKDDSEIVKESGLIDDGEIEKINGLVLGINSNKHFSYLGKSTANIMFDAKLIQLSNETPSKEIEISSVSYTVTMLNVEAANNTAKIKVEGNNEDIEKGKSKKINNIYVYLRDYTGTIEPSTWTVNLVTGSEPISLDTDGTSTKEITVGNTTYLIELLVGYTGTSSISVYSCDSKIVATVDTVSSNETNTTETNTTNETNETVEGLNETNEIEDIITNISSVDQNATTIKEGNFFSRNLLIILISTAGLIILLIILKSISSKRKQRENNKEDIEIQNISNKIKRKNS